MLNGRRLGLVLSLSVVLAAGAGGCGSDRPEPASGSSPSVVNFTSDQDRLIFDVGQELVRNCMLGSGFEYVMVPFIPDPIGDSRRWGVADRSVAETTGYHFDLPSQAEQAAYDTAQQRFLASLDDQAKRRYDQALSGDLTNLPPDSSVSVAGETVDIGLALAAGSCHEQAIVDLYGSRQTYLEFNAIRTILNRKRGEIDDRATGLMDDTLRRWSDCMASNGYSELANPLEAVDRFYIDAPAADAGEIRAAVADVACKDATEFIDRWRQAVSEASLDAQDNPALVELNNEIVANVVDRASALSE